MTIEYETVPPLLTLSLSTVLLIPIIGILSVVVTEAVSPVITLLKSLPTAEALFRNVPSLELVVAVKVSVDDPDADIVALSFHVRICPEIVGSVELIPLEVPETKLKPVGSVSIIVVTLPSPVPELVSVIV